MILLTTPSERAGECAAAIESNIGRATRVAESLQQAVRLLRQEEYSAVILDQCMLDADPGQAEVLLQHTGTAVVVNVNCAIAGSDRIVRELRAALRRRDKEFQAAREAAEQALWTELREPLTALLLECELALQLPNPSVAVREKLRTVHELACTIQQRLSKQEPVLAEK